MRVALYFGSFNPLHIGHIAICKYLIDNTDIDQVRLVVSPQNPLKSNLSDANGEKRLQNARRAIEGMGDKITVSDMEYSLPKPLYTINTLRKFSELEPENKFILIIGADNLEIIEKWRSWKDLLNEYEVWVYPRKGVDGAALCLKYNLKLIEAPIINVSSTEIRNAEEAGKDISHLKA